MTVHPDAELVMKQLQMLPIFAGLDETDMREMVRSARQRPYQAGEIVMMEGEDVAGLHFLQTGWIKVIKSSPSGREQVLRFFEPGDTFNEVAIFTLRPNPATAIALEPAIVWVIPREVLMRLLQERPHFAQQVIANMAERMLYLVSLVTDLSLRSVTARLARLLLDGAIDDVLLRPRWYTQSELAARLGTVPDVVQRALRSLENEGLIAVQRDQIRILKRQNLSEIAQ